MNAVYVLPGGGGRGGAELSLLKIAHGLKEAEFPVTITNLAANGSFSAIRPLAQLLRKERPRVLISGLRYTNIAAIAAARLAKSGTRIILTEHTPGYTGFRQQLIRPFVHTLYPYADAVVAVSQGIAKELAHCGGKLRVIYNPVVGDEPLPVLPAPHPWLEAGNPPVVIGVGRLSKEKNFALLLHAFKAALATRPLRLVILGEGEERGRLEALARTLGFAEHVLFPGFVENVYAWLARAAVFVSPSRYEGFGNAIVEAMHARVPVIATDCPVGPHEILDKGRFGKLVPTGDAAALAQAITATLEALPDIEVAYERARQFSERRCIEAYAALIKEIA